MGSHQIKKFLHRKINNQKNEEIAYRIRMGEKSLPIMHLIDIFVYPEFKKLNTKRASINK
jgi:hypothetical protein